MASGVVALVEAVLKDGLESLVLLAHPAQASELKQRFLGWRLKRLRNLLPALSHGI